MKKRIVCFVMTVLTVLSLAGCGGSGESTAKNEDQSGEGGLLSSLNNASEGSVTNTDAWAEATKENEAMENQSTVLDVSETEAKPAVPEKEYKFGENFDIVKGETVSLEGGVTFYLETIGYVNNNTRVTYVMTADGQEYPGIYFLYQDQTTWNTADVYNPYPIEFVKESMGTSTFCISKPAEVKAPTVLSNKASDSYTTTDYEYVEGERCKLYLKPGVTVSGDIIESIEAVMSELESQTKYSFDEETRVSNYRVDNVREQYYGMDPWPGVDNFHEKTSVYIVDNFEEGSTSQRLSCAMNNVVIIIEDDFNDPGWMSTLTHELTHVLFMRICNDFDDKLEEGLACYYARTVMLALPQYKADSSINENYYTDINLVNGGEYQLNASTAEQLFMTEFPYHDSATYSYGMYLITYLTENYTLDEMHRLFKSIDAKALEVNEYTPATVEMQAQALKDIYGDNVFTEFGSWYGKNSGRFRE